MRLYNPYLKADGHAAMRLEEAMRLVAKYRDAAHRPEKYGEHGTDHTPSRSEMFAAAKRWLADARYWRLQVAA